MMELIAKYDKPGPRYTSYPAYPYWNNGPIEEEWLSELANHKNLLVDLYIHVPYCQSLCTYCGCTRTISKNLDKGMDYTSLLLKEWAIYKEALPQIQIQSLHLGGGTPTFLRPEYLRIIFENLAPSLIESFSGAVEVDPRVTSERHIEVLKDFGISRFSLGIQDFDPKVQKAVNRIQPSELVANTVRLIRESSNTGINFDLIYGLPLQNQESIRQTIEEVKMMRPDTIALYGYAHVPWRSKAQKSLERYHIPHGEEKRALYELSKELLLEAGYRELGLDHFALEDSSLYQSYKDGQMKRNFMGYTKEVAPVTLGLGTSAISNTPNSFVQNEKELSDYEAALEKDRLPLANGHRLTQRDRLASDVIQSLMCTGKVDLTSYFEILCEKETLNHLGRLEEMEADGILTLSGGELRQLEVTDLGKPFLRNICMVFDEYFQLKSDGPPRFSRTI